MIALLVAFALQELSFQQKTGVQMALMVPIKTLKVRMTVISAQQENTAMSSDLWGQKVIKLYIL